ncbi:MAG TPA: FecR domain-containing protein [Niastella sp.]|nr:FecR domain-containing protein [Niastella sp.]
MKQNDHLVSLIAKQLQGMATPREAKELQQWLQSDAVNRQEYDEMVRIWLKTGPLLVNTEFNTDIAWAKLDNKIAQVGPSPNKQSHTGISRLFANTKRVAAVVIFAILAYGGYWWYKQAQWQTFTAASKNETITLPDQSVVMVRKGSTLTYPRSFDSRERRVQLTGEAFFQVQHNEAQPFLVTAGNSEVEVLGTSFLVNSSSVTDEVVVASGKVNVTDKKSRHNRVILTKGQRAILSNKRFYQEQVTDSNYIGWKTGKLVFNNTALQKVLEDISHFYGTQIELSPALQTSAPSIQITVEFKDQPLEQALEEIRLITGFTLQKEKDKVVFYRN